MANCEAFVPVPNTWAESVRCRKRAKKLVTDLLGTEWRFCEACAAEKYPMYLQGWEQRRPTIQEIAG
ncbi:MAG: hypothetical protein GEU73_06010 [Chloroflexi bacterium]|nr:hypothetical protein [Chloroflexota bacterium]